MIHHQNFSTLLCQGNQFSCLIARARQRFFDEDVFAVFKTSLRQVEVRRDRSGDDEGINRIRFDQFLRRFGGAHCRIQMTDHLQTFRPLVGNSFNPAFAHFCEVSNQIRSPISAANQSQSDHGIYLVVISFSPTGACSSINDAICSICSRSSSGYMGSDKICCEFLSATGQLCVLNCAKAGVRWIGAG